MQKVQSQSQDSLPPSTDITYDLQSHRNICMSFLCPSPTPIIACSRVYSFLSSGPICEASVRHSRLPSNLLAHRIILRFLLNLAPYAAVDKKLLHTLTLCRFQNIKDQMVHSDTFPNGKWNIEFSDSFVKQQTIGGASVDTAIARLLGPSPSP